MSNCESQAFPTFPVKLKWRQRPNRAESQIYHPRPRRRMPLTLDLTIHPGNSSRIIVNFPGLNEDQDGVDLRYASMAYEMHKEDLGAVVRSGNPMSELFLPSTFLKKIISYSQKNSVLISRSLEPELLLMGYSAGASAIASIATYYPRVSRILLIAPSGDMPKELVQANLRKFTGEVYILIGENDQVVGSRAGKIYYDLASSSIKRELLIVPDCDHFFRGKINDRIYRRAPFYAFAQDAKPDLWAS